MTTRATDQPPSAGAAPEGWQLVPKVPDAAMMEAGEHECADPLDGHPQADVAAVYRAMLAAAPVPSPDTKGDARARAQRAVQAWREARKPDNPDVESPETYPWLIDFIVREFAAPQGADAKPVAWRHEINYGPDGEANWSMIYDATGKLVANVRVHHAIAIVRAMNLAPTDPAAIRREERDAIVAWLRRSAAVMPGTQWFDSAAKAADAIERGDHLRALPDQEGKRDE